VGAALAQNNAANRLTAARAGLPCPAVHVVLALEIASLPLRVDVVRNGGSAMVNRKLEHRDNRAMQVFGTFFGETARACARMHPGGK